MASRKNGDAGGFQSARATELSAPSHDANDDRDTFRICVGAVAGAHGVKGDVRIKTVTENPMDIAAYGALWDEVGQISFEILESICFSFLCTIAAVFFIIAIDLISIGLTLNSPISKYFFDL